MRGNIKEKNVLQLLPGLRMQKDEENENTEDFIPSEA